MTDTPITFDELANALLERGSGRVDTEVKYDWTFDTWARFIDPDHIEVGMSRFNTEPHRIAVLTASTITMHAEAVRMGRRRQNRLNRLLRSYGYYLRMVNGTWLLERHIDRGKLTYVPFKAYPKVKA